MTMHVAQQRDLCVVGHHRGLADVKCGFRLNPGLAPHVLAYRAGAEVDQLCWRWNCSHWRRGLWRYLPSVFWALCSCFGGLLPALQRGRRPGRAPLCYAEIEYLHNSLNNLEADLQKGRNVAQIVQNGHSERIKIPWQETAANERRARGGGLPSTFPQKLQLLQRDVNAQAQRAATL